MEITSYDVLKVIVHGKRLVENQRVAETAVVIIDQQRWSIT
jgi:hypothetical protein